MKNNILILLSIVMSCSIVVGSEPPCLPENSLLKKNLIQDCFAKTIFWLSMREVNKTEGTRSCILRTNEFCWRTPIDDGSWEWEPHKHSGLTVIRLGEVIGTFRYEQEREAIDLLKGNSVTFKR